MKDEVVWVDENTVVNMTEMRERYETPKYMEVHCRNCHATLTHYSPDNTRAFPLNVLGIDSKNFPDSSDLETEYCKKTGREIWE